MNNNQFEGMSLDRINEFKREMQELMPLVEVLKIPNHANSLALLEKEQKLAIKGYSKREIKVWCKPREHTKEEADQMLKEAWEENQRQIRLYERGMRQSKL
jgi:hypothetical protein